MEPKIAESVPTTKGYDERGGNRFVVCGDANPMGGRVVGVGYEKGSHVGNER